MTIQIKNFLISGFLFLKKNFLKIFYIVFLSLLIILNSGHCYISQATTSTIRMLIYGVSLIFFFVNYLLKFNPQTILSIKNNKNNLIKKSNIVFLYYFLFLIGIIVSFLANKNKIDNLNSYLDFALILTFSYLVVKSVEFDSFVKYFLRILTVISIVSTILYLLVFAAHYNFNILNFYHDRIYGNYYFLLFNYNEKLYGITGSNRLMSIFWEPGVFGTILLFGILSELCFVKKTNYWRILLFTICILLTKSTASYILFILCFMVFLSEKLNNRSRITADIIFAIFLILLIVFYNKITGFLSIKLPSVFDKLNGSMSLTSRVLSPYYYLQVFEKNPIFGMGGKSANLFYKTIAPSDFVDSFTSTSGYMIASFGIIGFLYTLVPLISIFFLKKNLSIRIFLAAIFITIINKEGHAAVLFLNIFYLYFVENAFSTRKAKKELTVKDYLIKNPIIQKFISNISGSFIVKFGAILIGILTIPVYSRFFNDNSIYGVWLTLLSILSWILIFDFGFGNGMKNTLIKDGFNDREKCKTVISSTYIISSLIACFIALVGSILAFVLNFNKILNSPDAKGISVSIFILILAVSVNFILRNIGSIYQAKNQVALGTSLGFITNVLLLVFVSLSKNITANKLILLSCAYFVCSNLPPLIMNFVFFFKNRDLLPSIKFFKKDGTMNLVTLGLKFFIVQICTLVIWNFNDILIASAFSPLEVVNYTKYYKVFSTIVSAISIISYTIWVAASNAYKKNDYLALCRMYLLILISSIILIILSIIVSIFLQPIFDIWLNDGTVARFDYVLPFLIYSIVFILLESVIIFSNAFEIFKSIIVISLVFALLKFPVFYTAKSLFPSISWIFIVYYNIAYGFVALLFVFYEVFLSKKNNKMHGAFNYLKINSIKLFNPIDSKKSEEVERNYEVTI